MKTPQITPDWNTGIYIGNKTITKKPMRHAMPDYNDADLLACILSPYTTPEQKRAALEERSKRNNV
jgi:hypothetical protein